MTRQKFLLLGTGPAQLDLVRHVRAWGSMEIHALSNCPGGVAEAEVDVVVPIDIGDYQQVLAYARATRVDVLYSVGSDVAMPTAMWVSHTLGLPHFVAPQTADLCHNKHLWRRARANTYGAVPFVEVGEAVDEAPLGLPCMVKPTDSQGQRGVSVVTRQQEMVPAIHTALAHSRRQIAIIEQLIDGQEISVNAYLRDGEVIFLWPSRRISWPQYDGGIICKHTVPLSLSAETWANCQRLVSETCQGLGISNGPAYFQIMVQESQPYLIEPAPRLDGCHLWRLIAYASGIDLLALTLNHLLGQRPDDIPAYQVKKAALEFTCQPPESLYRPPHRDARRALVFCQEYYRNGDIVRRVNGKHEKTGYQIVGDEQ